MRPMILPQQCFGQKAFSKKGQVRPIYFSLYLHDFFFTSSYQTNSIMLIINYEQAYENFYRY